MSPWDFYLSWTKWPFFRLHLKICSYLSFSVPLTGLKFHDVWHNGLIQCFCAFESFFIWISKQLWASHIKKLKLSLSPHFKFFAYISIPSHQLLNCFWPRFMQYMLLPCLFALQGFVMFRTCFNLPWLLYWSIYSTWVFGIRLVINCLIDLCDAAFAVFLKCKTYFPLKFGWCFWNFCSLLGSTVQLIPIILCIAITMPLRVFLVWFSRITQEG